MEKRTITEVATYIPLITGRYFYTNYCEPFDVLTEEWDNGVYYIIDEAIPQSVKDREY